MVAEGARVEEQQVKRRLWTISEDEILWARYPHEPTQNIARLLNRSIPQVYRKAWILGLKKSDEYLASPHACRLRRGDKVGWAHRFQKGHIPANKGLRRPGWAPGRMAVTQFKKGERRGAALRNWKSIGTVLPDTDGYMRRKIAEGVGGFGNQRVWEFVHRRVWEDAHGPIPPGYVVVFKDGDKTNTALENLELISRRDLMSRNTVHNYPPELAQVIQLAGALKRKIRNRENAKEQNG